MKIYDEIKYYTYLFTLLAPELYSAYTFLLGKSLEEEDGMYLVLTVMISFFTLVFLFIDYVRNNYLINIKILIIPIFFIVCYLFDTCLEAPVLEWTRKSFLFNLLYSVPPILMASVLLYSQKIEELYKRLDVVMLLLSLGMVASLPKMMSAGNIIEGYNNISYQSALAFGYLYYGIFANRMDRYAFFKTYFYKLVSILLCILLCLTSLSSGGRGGCVLLFISMAVVSLLYMKSSNIYKVLLIFVPLSFAFSFAISYLVSDTSFASIARIGMKRAFSYVSSSGGIDIAHSGRQESYETAIRQIQDSPIWGHGIFHTIGTTGYPHNIFLELWESGGLFYLGCWLVIFLSFIRKAIWLFGNKEEYSFIIPLLCYPCVMLQFSGSYLMNSVFWFFVSFFFLIHKEDFVQQNENI